jgi:tellurite resistance protein
MIDIVDTAEHTSTAPRGSGRRPATDTVSDVIGRHAARAARIGLLSVSLGAAGLGGAWQAAATTFPPALQVSDALFTVSGLIWLVLLAQYLRHGGARWRNLRHDLRHPGQGFTLGYVPIIGAGSPHRSARKRPWNEVLSVRTMAQSGVRQCCRSSRPGTPVSVGHDGRGMGGHPALAAHAVLAGGPGRAARGLLSPSVGIPPIHPYALARHPDRPQGQPCATTKPGLHHSEAMLILAR